MSTQPTAETSAASSAAARQRGLKAGRHMPGGDRHRRSESLLCVANFGANTGFAWDYIEGLYAELADRMASYHVVTRVAYPSLRDPPAVLEGSAAAPFELDVKLGSAVSIRATLRFVRKNNVKVIYLADRPVWHPAYALLRMAGVRRIVVHDHTSGERTIPRGLKRVVKRLTRRLLPSMLADIVVAVSDYVARRKVEIDLVPAERVVRIWNSLPVPQRDPEAALRLRSRLNLAPDVPVIACAGRAARDKGIEHLLRAFDRMKEPDAQAERSVLVYLGDGPDLPRLQEIRAGLKRRDRVFFTGYVSNAARLLGQADLCVVPSVWQEAFGLSVLEPMLCGVPVIATRVGGIPEIMVDGETGLLVPAADESALAAALERLLSDPATRQRMGTNGRSRAITQFSRERQIDALATLVQAGFERTVPASPEVSFQ